MCVSEQSKPLSPQGCFRCSQSHQGEQKESGFNLEHWGLNWVYVAKLSVWDGNSVVRFDWPFLGFFQIVSMLPKGTDFPNARHHHQHHHNRQHHRHHHQCHRGTVWGGSLIKSDLVRSRSSSSITIVSCIFSQLHLFGGVGTALSFLRTDRWLHQTMSKCVQRWSLEATVDA